MNNKIKEEAMSNEVKPARVIAAIVNFYQEATLEIFAQYIYGTPEADINDYHKGKFRIFQDNIGKYLCYLDYEHRRKFARGVLKYAEDYEKKHDLVLHS